MVDPTCSDNSPDCALERMTGGLCRRLIDESPVALAIVGGSELIVRYANRAYRNLRPDVEMAGRRMDEIWPEQREFVSSLQRAVIDEVPFADPDRRLEVEPRDDGPVPTRYFTLIVTPTRFCDEAAALIEVTETTHEVHAKFAAEEYGAAVARRAEELDRVLERIGDGFFALDREWRFTYANKHAEELLRRPREELLGGVIWDLFPEAVGTPFQTAYQRALLEQEPVDMEGYYAPLDLSVRVRAYPDVAGISVFFEDLGAEHRKEAELAGLRERAAMLARYLESSSQPFAAGTPDGRFLMVNRAFAEMLGYSEAELMAGGLTFADVSSPATQAVEQAELERLHETREPVRYEKEYIRSDGSIVYAEVLVHAVADENGGVESYYSFMTDITARHHAEILNGALNEIDTLVHSTLEFDEIMHRSLSAVVDVLGAVNGSVVEYDEHDGATVRYTYPEGATEVRVGQVFSAEEAPFTKLIRKNKRPLIVHDTRSNEAFIPELSERYGLVGFLAIPLIMRGTAFAGIGLNFAEPREFDAVESEFIDKLANSISLALENAQLYREREQTIAELESKDQAIRAAYSDAIAAVTGGRLVLLGNDELDQMLLPAASPPLSVDEPKDLCAARAELRRLLGDEPGADDVLLAFGEAITNTLKHAGKGSWELRREGDLVQVLVRDAGAGIDFRRLPKAALVAGFSTQTSLGVGFTVMLELSDRLLLCTGSSGTSLVIERRLTERDSEHEQHGRPPSAFAEELALLGQCPL